MFANEQQIRNKRFKAGDLIDPRQVTTIDGLPIRLPDREGLVHIQFRRFAGCPLCNLHLRSMTRRYDEVSRASIREVVVFHSSREELLPFTRDLPFAVIADPEKRLYRAFAVESSRRALLDPRAWIPISHAVFRSLLGIIGRQHPVPPINPPGGRLGLPADFLIASDGHVLACKYGEHAYDQWSVDELLAVAEMADRGTRTIRERASGLAT
jgi:peroxiredoxin